MRVFYIFKIKDEFKYLYKDSPSQLYNLLKQIYYLGKEDIAYGENIFYQLVEPMDKELFDRKLFIKLHKEIPYSKRGEIHIMNNLYKDEISRLIIKNTYMKIETESSFSSFFNYLTLLNDNLFACDFSYIDFFFLDKIKTLV
ncbi:MAG: sporulation inhibitor of replication protein SirA [Bacilli bacterium]|nr:sporulation inhibitor of replication protein SirA [Bacilli bacterium]